MASSIDLIRKLQLKPGARLWLINMPHELAEALTAGAEIKLVRAGEPCTGVIAFCANPTEATTFARQALKVLPPDGLLWMAYRKGAAAKASGLTRDIGWSALFEAGWTTVRSIALDDTWTGLRFRPDALVKH